MSRRDRRPPSPGAVATAARRYQHAIICLLIACLAMPLAWANGTVDSVEHVVVVWLKTPGNSEHRRRIIAESEVLLDIPGVTGLRAGVMIPSERPIVDSSFDVAMIISFTDTAAMQAYLDHPVHVKLVKETLKPLVNRIRVYDFR